MGHGVACINRAPLRTPPRQLQAALPVPLNSLQAFTLSGLQRFGTSRCTSTPVAEGHRHPAVHPQDRIELIGGLGEQIVRKMGLRYWEAGKTGRRLPRCGHQPHSTRAPHKLQVAEAARSRLPPVRWSALQAWDAWWSRRRWWWWPRESCQRADCQGEARSARR
jgi:hypothetical protein